MWMWTRTVKTPPVPVRDGEVGEQTKENLDAFYS
jgi:hypothetical protein